MTIILRLLSILLLLLLLISSDPICRCDAFDYSLDDNSPDASFNLMDVATGISHIKTIFFDEPTNVTVTGISWIYNPTLQQQEETTTPIQRHRRMTNVTTTNVSSSDNYEIIWMTYVDQIMVDNGTYSLWGIQRQLPTEIPCGTFLIPRDHSRQQHNITIRLWLDDSELIVTQHYSAYPSVLSTMPLLIVLLLAILTSMVEISLVTAILIGSCMIYGNLRDGFKETMATYLIGAMSDPGHCFVILFTSFLAGFMTLMEKSGGMKGFTLWCQSFATTPNLAQLTCFLIGILIFFDDYSNVLLAGQTMKPLFDSMHISREKLAFIICVMAPCVVILSPISSWIGFEINLMEPEIARIIKQVGNIDDVTIQTSGMGVFFRSIQYQYYPIYMICMTFFVVLLRHDCGWMLHAERRVAIFEKTDGGEGRGQKSGGGNDAAIQPAEHTPARAYNMYIPIILLVALVVYLMLQTGTIEGAEQSLLNKIENSDSNASLLWGTMAATLCTIILYLCQWYQIDGPQYTMPPFLTKYFCLLICEKPSSQNDDDEQEEEEQVDSQKNIINNKNSFDKNAIPTFIGQEQVPEEKEHKEVEEGAGEEEEEKKDPMKDLPRPLVSFPVAVEAFFYGMASLFRPIVVLILAWSIGHVMVDVGTDRLFTRLILNHIQPPMLPTLTFLISFIIGLSTGSAWGTMSMIFPLVLVPTYISTDGNERIFYAVTASILSGSVAGNTLSPISDTTILATLAADCDVMKHIITRTPYLVVGLISSVLFGSLLVGFDALPNLVILAIGCTVMALFVYFVCAPVWATDGRYDWFTEGLLRIRTDSRLEELRQDTILYFCVASIYVKDTAKQSRFMKRYLEGVEEVPNDEFSLAEDNAINADFSYSDTYFNSAFINLSFLQSDDSETRANHLLSFLHGDPDYVTSMRPKILKLLDGDIDSFATKTASILNVLKQDTDTETRTASVVSMLAGNVTDGEEGDEEIIFFEKEESSEDDEQSSGENTSDADTFCEDSFHVLANEFDAEHDNADDREGNDDDDDSDDNDDASFY